MELDNINISKVLVFLFWIFLIINRFRNNNNYLILFKTKTYYVEGLSLWYKLNLFNSLFIILSFLNIPIIFDFWVLIIHTIIFIFSTIRIRKG